MGIDVRNRRAIVISWLLVLVWAGVIFAASAKSALELDSGTGMLSAMKMWLGQVLSEWAGHEVDPSPIGHFGEYLVFGALLFNAFARHMPGGRATALSIATAALYAASDEFHQYFVPGRACDPLDWLVDMAAVCLATLICWLVLRRWQHGAPSQKGVERRTT